MNNRDHYYLKSKERHNHAGVGWFFILLGLALLVATNDLLSLGSVSKYFTWQSAMIFIGVFLILNQRFAGGLFLIAGGIWFLLDDIYIVIPRIIEVAYWPAVLILVGIIFILSSLLKRKNNTNL